MDLDEAKARLIAEIRAMGALRDARVRRAFESVPRENFVPADYRHHAYANYPLPIAGGQTISQPYTVAVMSEALDVGQGMCILEVGAGSGYQAAILAELVGARGKVITCEIIEELFVLARERLQIYPQVTVVHTDGSRGWKPGAPYDRILVAAAGTRIPEPLVDQLKDNGILVMPVGQEMIVATKKNGALDKKMIGYFAFVPLKEGKD